ncbi:hypothetical protein [Tomitella biformata]|uniref:hypothetical protein n=1 Tax=Tomitella biformata TaxID=630403 RepID=UPI0011DCC6EE|nr:hypothetical protein [Tomitella biformata]
MDILVPKTGPDKIAVLGGRGFDAAPGLSLALSRRAVEVDVDAQLQDGRKLRFTVPIPDVEAALVLKALAWQSRLALKDASDIATLLEIANVHRDAFDSRWMLDDPLRAARGERLDAARALHQLADRLDRGVVAVPQQPSPRLIALIRRHVYAPSAGRRL